MKKTFLTGLGVAALCVLICGFWTVRTLSSLPDVASLKHYRPAAAAEVLDQDGNVLTEFYDRKFRIWVPLSSLPDIVIHAVVTAEDDTFFEHKGVNYGATWDALILDVQKRRFARGGSTITQQMIKNVLLSREKTIGRKLREYVLARKAEELLSKRQILEIYLNEVEWGENIYGIEAASRFYLDKHAASLTPAEAALLAGMLPNPRYYNPFKRPDKAKGRQERVLANMLQAKLITPEESESALKDPPLRSETSGKFDFSALNAKNGRPCYQHALEQVLLTLFGEQAVYRGGRTIRTSLNKGLQNAVSLFEDVRQDPAGQTPAKVTVIQEGKRIRAILCTPGKERTLRDMAAAGLPHPFETTTLLLDSITQDQLVLSVDGEKP